MKNLVYALTPWMVIGFFSLTAQAGEKKAWGDILTSYQCLEIEKFFVDRNDYSTKEMERAAAIPEERITSLQHKIVGEISRKNILTKAVKADKESCEGKALVFGGKVMDYKQGNRAARILIGLGAGKQKFSVDCFMKDKETGQVLAKKTIIDRKVGGIAGGGEEKGESDFAEKVVHFVKSGA